MPPKVLIGVHLTAGSQDVGDTLRALYETTREAFEVAILVDPAPSEATGVAAAIGGTARREPVVASPRPAAARRASTGSWPRPPMSTCSSKPGRGPDPAGSA